MTPLVHYAKKHRKDPSVVRRRVRANHFQTARKYGAHWFIDEDEPYPADKRHGNRRGNLLKDCKCQRCGAQFRGGARAKYCLECRQARKLEYQRERRENISKAR